MRPPLAAILGIVVTLGLSFVGQIVTTVLVSAPDDAPLPIGRTVLSATLAVAFFASVIGAFVGSHLAASRRGIVALAIALAAALFGVLSALTAPEGTPAPIAWAMPIVAFVGALGGGAIRAMNGSARSPV